MCHADRALLHDWLTTHGGTVDGAGVLRRKVVAARGEHEAEEAIAALRAETDPAARLQQAQTWWEAQPRDPRLTFELAGAHDAAGKEREAIRWYDEALGARAARAASPPGADPEGREPAAPRRASTRPRRCWTTWAASARAAPPWPPSGRSCAATRASPGAAVADLIEALLAHAGDADDDAYREVLHRFARELR